MVDETDNAEGSPPVPARSTPPGPTGFIRSFAHRLRGELAGPAHGFDVDVNGGGIVGEQRTDQLIRPRGTIADRRFEIEFLKAGVEAYCFTFG